MTALSAVPALAQSAEKAQRIATLNEARSSGLAPAGRSAATCQTGTASTDLDIGGVRARLYNNGGLFWRGGDPVYEVPKGSGIQAIFAAGLWIGAEVADELRFAGADYSDWEYWPGPLDANGEAPADCTPFDRFWTVAVQPDGSLTGDVANWPVDLGAAFDDANGDGEYDPAAGDRPTVYGHQTTFWVMNDKGNVHEWSRAEPLGVEVRVTAFAVDSADPTFGFATFYRYEIVNKSADVLENLRVGFWNDADLGDFTDDFVGSDPERGLSFIYNADNTDVGGYETPPPALGVDLLSGAEGMVYYNNDFSPTGNPSDGQDAYGYLNFSWRDETPITVGGTGYNPADPGAELTTWFFSGTPEEVAFWSELNATAEGTPNTPGDRRFVAVASPTILAPGATTTVDLAILFGLGSNHRTSVGALRTTSDQVQAAYDDGSLFEPFGPRTGPPVYEAPDPEVLPGEATALMPAEGFDFNAAPDLVIDGEARFTWDPVPGALYYIVELADEPTFGESQRSAQTFGPPRSFITPNTEVFLPVSAVNSAEPRYWRVFGGNATAETIASQVQTFITLFDYEPGIEADGLGIIEVSYAGANPCDTDPGKVGCADYGGATVWHTPSTNDDYYVTGAGANGTIDRVAFRVEIAPPFDYEMRFTEACATGDCWGVYTVLGGLRDDGIAVQVPFELWQVLDNEDGTFSEDVRMIPVVLALDEPGAAWPYSVEPGDWDGSGYDGGATPGVNVSDIVYWMIPDRPGGYDLFAADAASAGGGNFIVDSDDQEDLDPTSGAACRNQGFYIDFCHRNDEVDGLTSAERAFMAPLGRFQLADEAGDGTPPPSGTTLRVLTQKPLVTNAEDPVATLPQTLALEAYPNPTRTQATLRLDLPATGALRVAVYDVLGREVQQVVNGTRAAGSHEVRLETGRLATGLYVVVVEAGASRASQKLLVVK